jgi:RNA polymerase sigma-70 factor (ECF subfamily)
VYRTHFELVWRTLSKFGVREADLMDVTQNAFMVVQRQLSGFEGRSPVTTWLFGICRLVASDYRRSAPIRREVLVDFDEFDDLPDVGRETPLEHLDRKKMSEGTRSVFVLFAFREMSGDEIASLLQIPVGTVRSRLRLTRERIGADVARFLAISIEDTISPTRQSVMSR